MRMTWAVDDENSLHWSPTNVLSPCWLTEDDDIALAMGTVGLS